MKRKKTAFLILIFLLAFVLRLAALGKIPPGITDDEASVAYDTYLLSQTGKDQWGKAWPLEFKSFGDYRLPVYQYLLLPFIKIFGLKAWVVRLPTALAGSLTVLLIYFFIVELFKKYKYKKALALVSALILALNPWHFGMSRWLMEANVGLFFTLLAIFFSLKKKKNHWLWVAIFSCLSFYTYYSLRLFLPLFLGYLIFFDQRWSRKKVFSFGLISLLLCLPILFSLLKTGGGLARVKQINITHDLGLVNQSNQYREACFNSLGFLSKKKIGVGLDQVCLLVYNRPVFWLRQLVLNYFNHFSFSFLFFESFERAFQFLPPQPFFYFFNLPFLLIGLLQLFLSAFKKWKFLIVWLLIAPLADSVSTGGHYARSFVIILPIIVFIAAGWQTSLTLLRKKLKSKAWFLLVPLFGFCLFYTIQFFFKYFTYFPTHHSKYSHYIYKPLFSFLNEVEKNYDHIYISRKVQDQRQYIFYLFYQQIPAQQYFQAQKVWEEEEGGWIMVRQLNKYHFIDDPNQVKQYPSSSLLVVSFDEVEENAYLRAAGSIKTINFLNQEPAFKIFKTNDFIY